MKTDSSLHLTSVTPLTSWLLDWRWRPTGSTEKAVVVNDFTVPPESRTRVEIAFLMTSINYLEATWREKIVAARCIMRARSWTRDRIGDDHHEFLAVDTGITGRSD
jgi:hypothetical protein